MDEKYGNEEEIINTSFNFNTNEKELARLCFYSMDEQFLFEKYYSFNISIGDAINEFLEKQESNDKFSFSFYVKGNNCQLILIDEQKLISYYLKNLHDTLLLIDQGLANNSDITTSMCSNKFLKIYAKRSQFLKNIPENIEQYIIKNTQFVGMPLINKLEYYVYDKECKDAKINLIKLSEEVKEKIQINFFSRKSAYCNAENNLYIYEGTKPLLLNNNNISINSSINFNNYNSKFICINLKNNDVNLISTEFPQRILHSMIFIPKNYIFIVGGKNAKEVLIFMISNENKTYEKYPYFLPCELFEPSLILIDNKYLYAFENSGFCLHIIRTNFISQTPFEEIQLKNSYLQINQKFFGVVKNKNSILFLGGQMVQENKIDNDENSNDNCFEYNYLTESLTPSRRPFIPIDFYEKTLIPLDGEEYIQIAEICQNNDYVPSIFLFKNHVKKSDITNTLTLGTQKTFKSVKTKGVLIKLPDNMTSLVASSSIGEMGIPLYNNIDNK